ncbi:Shedu anti-phage system protein SduA domain-containing protein [Streptomyces sp. NPDC001422]|uniref:Shedu anti-phage system protein SduA domain-containing protein n=1 Tax=Streptomyces sp. NPDC001422 TaxID=3364575 RepID=UPI0036C4BEFA
MTPEENLVHLSELLDKDHERPSNNKYPEARDFTAEMLDLLPSGIYFTYVGRVSNFSVRAVQSAAAMQATVVVALIKLRTEDEATHRAARRIATKTGKTILLLQRVSDDSLDWAVMGGYYVSVDRQTREIAQRIADSLGGPSLQGIELSPSEAATSVLEYFDRLGLTGEGVGAALSQRRDISSIIAFAAASSAAGLSAAETAIIAKRRALIAELKRLIADPSTKETDLHKKIKGNYWIFGGRYTGVARASIMPMDRYDIPLFCADGSLHIVELKGSYITQLIKRHRQHLIPGEEVHEAAMQAANYIRQLDEGGAAMETIYRNSGLNYDLRRGRATVVIGNQDFVDIPEDPARQLGAVTRGMVDQTIRTYNSLINRVEVLTWTDLLDAADRSLRFEEEIAENLAADAPAEAGNVHPGGSVTQGGEATGQAEATIF